MEAEAFERSLRGFVRRTPFRPFVVEMVSGSRIEVDHPEAVVVMRAGDAVFVSPEGEFTLFDHEGVARLDETRKVAGMTG